MAYSSRVLAFASSCLVLRPYDPQLYLRKLNHLSYSIKYICEVRCMCLEAPFVFGTMQDESTHQNEEPMKRHDPTLASARVHVLDLCLRKAPCLRSMFHLLLPNGCTQRIKVHYRPKAPQVFKDTDKHEYYGVASVSTASSLLGLKNSVASSSTQLSLIGTWIARYRVVLPIGVVPPIGAVFVPLPLEIDR
ncbi:hypothetical protein GW17_00000215 [Ensete ventricosum]|nr:hypothetical protein GW17_00000215 [Ensete ventricosum]